MKMEIHSKKQIFFWYSAAFLVTAALTFSVFAVFGKTFLIENDGFLQHYPLLVKLRELVKGVVLQGKGVPFWGDDIGLGGDTIGNLSIIFTDPFNYIAAAFPIPYIDIGYSAACILRLYAAGLAMMAFLCFHKISGEKQVIGALSYAFSYWAIGVINHGFFMLPLILFPLVILGIDKVFEGKSPLTLIFAVWFSFITYAYFAYMTGIAAGIYVAVRLASALARNEKKPREAAGLILRLFLYVVIAGFLAAPILISMIYTLMNASKTSGTPETTVPSAAELFRFFPAFISGREVFGHYSYIGTNALLAAAVPFLLFKGKGRKRNRIPALLFFCFLAAVLFPGWGRFMNGMSYRMGRWCYILVFFFVYAAVEGLEQEPFSDRRGRRYALGWAAFLLICCLVLKDAAQLLSQEGLAVCLWNLACMLVFVLLGKGKWKRRLCLLIVNISAAFWLIFSPFCGDRLGTSLDQGQAYKMYRSSVLRAYPELNKKEKDFFRVDFQEHVKKTSGKYEYAGTPANENLYWGARTLSGYLSTTSQELFDFNTGLMNAGATFRRMCSYSMDGRSRLNFLLGTRYFLYEADKPEEELAGYAGIDVSREEDIGKIHLAKMGGEASMGYLFTESMTRAEYEMLSPLEKEQALMQKIVLETEPGQKAGAQQGEGSYTAEGAGIRLLEYSMEGEEDEKSFTVKKETKTLRFRLPECTDGEVYVLFKNLRKTPFTLKERREADLGKDSKTSRYSRMKYDLVHGFTKLYGNFDYYPSFGKIKKRVIYAEGEAQAIIDRHDFLTNLGYYKETPDELEISFSDPGHYSYDAAEMYFVPAQSFREQAKVLSDNRFRVEKYSPDHIYGAVSAKKKGYLFLNILHHPGWEAWVDGQKVRLQKADVCFIGLELEKGEHQIELRFRPIGYRSGMFLFALGAAATLGIWLKSRRKMGGRQAII